MPDGQREHGSTAGDPGNAANLEKIDHVVVVMLENRSFDHMLGYLSLESGRPDIDGLRSGFANQYQGAAYAARRLGTTALDVDPDHCATAVDEQVANGMMDGFASSFWRSSRAAESPATRRRSGGTTAVLTCPSTAPGGAVCRL